MFYISSDLILIFINSSNKLNISIFYLKNSKDLFFFNELSARQFIHTFPSEYKYSILTNTFKFAILKIVSIWKR